MKGQGPNWSTSAVPIFTRLGYNSGGALCGFGPRTVRVAKTPEVVPLESPCSQVGPCQTVTANGLPSAARALHLPRGEERPRWNRRVVFARRFFKWYTTFLPAMLSTSGKP